MVVLNFKGSYFRPGITDFSDLDSFIGKSYNRPKDELLM